MARVDPILCERIARNGLAAPRCATPAQAAALTTAVQAQDNQASRFGLHVRAAGLTEDAVTAAIADQRSIVRTWLMRGTIHLVDAADLRWLVALIGPSVISATAARRRNLELTETLLARCLGALPEILTGHELTRHEVRAALAERGVVLDSPDPQAITHLMIHASYTGLVCRGPDRGRESTFVLTDEWLPSCSAPFGPLGDDALAELARRYFTAFGPATAADFTTWSGLAGAKAVGLIRDELTEVDVYGRPGFRHGEVASERATRLLPAFDNYLLGYRERAAILTEPHYRRVYFGGIIRPSVLVNGRVVGSWALNRAKKSVTLTPFESLPRTAMRAIEREVAELGRFTALDLALAVEPVS